MKRAAALLELFAGLVAAASCYAPETRDCSVQCGDGDACPRDMHCSNGACVRDGGYCPPREPGPTGADVRCDPEARRCAAGSSVESCSADGTWLELERCEGETPMCAFARCVGCVPGVSRCASESRRETCDSERFRQAPPCPSWTPVCAGSVCEPAIVLAAGGAHTCAKLGSGEIVCWGENSSGQLGTGDRLRRGGSELDPELASVSLGATAQTVVTGGAHSCALLEAGAVKCWGENHDGQLGLGDDVDRGVEPEQMGALLPLVDLGSERPVIALAAGNRHTCALSDDGAVKCWGANESGQLGLGDRRNRGDEPHELGANLQRVPLADAATAIDAGDEHTCAVLVDGSVECWGADALGQLGTFGGELPRVGLDRGDRAVAVSAGGNHACALLADAGVVCWGYNRSGQLGSGDFRNRGRMLAGVEGELARVALGSGRTALAVSAGANHTCALLADRRVTCWGNNLFGELGRGTDDTPWGDRPEELGDALLAVDLGTRDGAPLLAAQISSGTDFTCAVLDGDTAKCWGVNASGQLGLEHTEPRGRELLGEALPVVRLFR